MTDIDMADLEKKINSPDEAQRLYAVQDLESDDVSILGQILLKSLVKESSATVRAAIAFRLKTIVSAHFFPELFDLFRSPDAYLRNASVGIFAAGGELASEYLGRHVNDADREVRKLILDALFEIGTDAARALIRQALDDPAVNVQVTAVEYLGQLEDDEEGPRMVELLRINPEPMLIMAILDALARLQRRDLIVLALETLASDGDYSRIKPLYLPQAMELLAICGQGPEMIQVMIALSNHSLYAENIVRSAFFYFKNQGSEDVNSQLLSKLMALIVDESVEAQYKFMAGRILVSHGPGRLKPEALFALGERLVSRETDKPMGLELIAASGGQKSFDRLKALAQASDDPVIVEMCQELMARAKTE